MELTITPGRREYRYLWLKNITGIRLGDHCAAAFKGHYHSAIDADRKTPTRIELDPADVPYAVYLCGVVKPWNWQANAHLAIVPAEGETWEGYANPPGGTGDLLVSLVDAAPVFGWGPESINPDHPKAHIKSYATCRNWQFAHHLATVRGLKDDPNPYAVRAAAAKKKKPAPEGLF